MNRSIEHSFKARMRNIAAERRVTPAELWETVVLERILVRVSKSRFASNFVLKGGVLLSTYVNINRHTQDIDFSVRGLSNRTDDLASVLEEILEIDCSDGFAFSDLKLIPLTHPHMKYPGARAKLVAGFGKARFKVIMDFGYGDLIASTTREHPLTTGVKGALFESHVEIQCYPPEFIFAEKLESVVFYGSRNSRMKDFHDLYKLTCASVLHDNLEAVVTSVFAHRGTELKLPLDHSSIASASLQNLWSQHIGGLKSSEGMPATLTTVVEHINGWLNSNTALCSRP